jgi:hypothetical protein
MKKSLILAIGAVAAVLVALPSSANAQVAFGGTFRGPHGSVSIGVGGFEPIVGAYVPSPYIDQIYYLPDYGYGFYYDDEWVPCQQYGSAWVISAAPFFLERPFVRGYGYSRPYYSRPYYSRPFVGRSFRRDWGGQRFGRDFSNRSGRDFGSRSGRDFSNRSGHDFGNRSGRDFNNRSGRGFDGRGSGSDRRR